IASSLSTNSYTFTLPDALPISEKLVRMCEIKASRDGRVADYAREFGLTYLEGKQPWGVPVDIALPCATQNELDVDAARTLISNGDRKSTRLNSSHVKNYYVVLC